MRYLIVLEQTENGFAVQAPDLAVITYGKDVETAKQAAIEAIRVNLETYEEIGKPLPKPRPVTEHLENPDFSGLLFAYVDIMETIDRKAA
jgi:predicted RNase H-like HicB family nuclease